jgi:dihydropteroate synthase
MTIRVLSIEDLASAEKELRKIGSEKEGIRLMAPKACFSVLKIYNLSTVAANIIKQEMLSYGGEAATAYGAINYTSKTTDLLVFGTFRQFRDLVKKLKRHQFGLPKVAEEIDKTLSYYYHPPEKIKIGHKVFNLKGRTHLVGILNVTPDSFSDGGLFYKFENAVRKGLELAEEGAEIIDLGGESTRPFARPVPEAEEMRRVIPVVKALTKEGLIISVDTRKAMVAQAALDAGAKLINDVSGLRYDKKMAKIIARYQVPVCLMHMRGTPATMQKNPVYQDLIKEILEELNKSIEIAQNAGILLEKIIVDPGIGFGKTVEHNLEIFKRLDEFKVLGRPILVGPSRKSVIGKVLNLPVEERLEGTAALVALAVAKGANFVRVHDVKAMKRVVKMVEAVCTNYS